MSGIPFSSFPLANIAEIQADFQLYAESPDGEAFRVQLDEAVAAAISGGGSGGLDAAYDSGGAGVGRTIIADAGAVKVAGTDGLLVTGVLAAGAVSEWVGAGAYDVGMFFNPKKGAFRAGRADGAQWDDVNMGSTSTAMGFSTTASGPSSTTFGENTTASGNVSTAMGSQTTALSLIETVIGFWNTVYTPVSSVLWDASDRLFSIANGTSSIARSDAFIILKSGKITCPSTTGSFTPNVLTTTERNALTATAGMLVYNSTTNKHQGYDGAIWNDLY